MTEETPIQAGAEAAGPHPGPLHAVREWFLRSAALREAAPHALADWQRRCAKNARRAAEVARRAMDAQEPFDEGPALPAAVSLFRESVYWALYALQPSEPEAPPRLAELYEASPRELLVHAASGEAGLALIETHLVGESFVETATLADDDVERLAKVAATFSDGVLQQASRRDDRIATLRRQRWSRGFSVLFALLVVVLGVFVATRPPNLAKGKRWTAVGGEYGYAASGTLDVRGKEDLLFHTSLDPSPWVVIDLDAVRSVSRVHVTNRRAFGERALPLAVQLSLDNVKYTDVAQTKEPFVEWDAKFPKQRARYVRLRVLRESWLHLEDVAIY